jgi:uncharacterized membrane protein YheB (UPF0754 family)
LIHLLFSELSSLSKRTALLEALDWSEDKLDHIIETCSIAISEMSDNPRRFSKPSEFKQYIKSKLNKDITEDQINCVFNLINDIISSSMKELSSYEN